MRQRREDRVFGIPIILEKQQLRAVDNHHESAVGNLHCQFLSFRSLLMAMSHVTPWAVLITQSQVVFRHKRPSN
jgi:hypothetical protein